MCQPPSYESSSKPEPYEPSFIDHKNETSFNDQLCSTILALKPATKAKSAKKLDRLEVLTELESVPKVVRARGRPRKNPDQTPLKENVGPKKAGGGAGRGAKAKKALEDQ